MTDPRRQRFSLYLRDLADRMRLRDWTIVLHDDPPSGDRIADIHPVYGRRYATIRLSDRFLGDVPEEQRHCLVHELVHCHVDAAWMIALDSIPHPASEAFKRMAEHGVDSIAEVIAPMMPIPWFADTI